MSANRVKGPYRLTGALATAVHSALMVSVAGAADYTWNNAGGGDYATGTNWTPNAPAGAPGSLDRSIFNLNNTYTVTFGANVVNAGFAQSRGNVTFGIGGGRTYTLNSSAFELGNTAGQTATLFVPSGTFAINASTSGIGTVAGSTGFLSVAGAGSSFTSAGYCDVGISGAGILEIADGASATIAPGSYVAAQPGSNGEIRIGGAGASANLGGSLSIGREGTGILSVQNGGTAHIGPSLVVGYGSGAQGSVFLSGFTAGTINSSGMTLGYLGTAVLNINAGSTLNNSGDVYLAYNSGAIATATVGHTWNQSGGSVYVGGYNSAAGGQATLNVTGTLAVTGTGNGVVIRGSGVGPNNGTLNLAGGLLSTPNFTRDPDGVFNFTGGTLQIDGGTLNLNQTNLVLNGVGAGPTLTFNGPGSSFATASTNLTVGSTGSGALRVLGGAQPAVASFRAGDNPGATGTILVSGTGSVLSTSAISYIGVGGNGSLTVESGGRYVSALDVYVALAAGNGTLTVTGPGSQVELAPGRTLIVGSSSAAIGTVNVSNGASLSAQQIYLGYLGGRGNLNVTGSGASLNLGGGGFGLGRILVGNSAGLPSTATFGFGATIDAEVLEVFTGSTVNLNGATLNLDNGYVPSGGTFNFNSGTLDFTFGWVASLAQVHAVLGTSATLAVGRTIQQSGTFGSVQLQSPLTLNGGTLNTNALVTNGYLNFVTGTLGITGGGGLTIGSSGALGANVTLNSGQTLNVSALTAVNPGAVLMVQNGRLDAAGGLINNGEVQLDGTNSRITGGAVTNNKLILGEGRISGNLVNNTTGELRATGGERLLLAGASNTNNGRINLVNGGTVEFTAALNNSATGRIAGRGTLITGGTLTNNGQIALSAGFSDVFAAITNNNDILITGGGTTTFYNPISNAAAGDIFVAAESAVVFLGAVTGAGTLSGSGTKYFADGSSVLAALDSPGSSVVESAAQVTTGYVRERSLDVWGEMTIAQNGTAGGTSRVNDLVIGIGGGMDVKDNKLIVAGGAGGAGDVGAFDGVAYSGLSGFVQRGYNFGAWDGDGLVTTMFDAGPSRGITTLAVATADETFYAGGTFGGVAVASGDALVMYTYAGDLNLDGLVDGADYGAIDNWVLFPGTSGYSNGDINYDGVIDGADYGIIDNTVQLQGAPIPINASASAALSAVTAVPEPSACAFAILAAHRLLAPRRRRQRGR